ncbi:hypothetical protein KXX34_007611 [Aspergillus fumigatus]|nr:hypothetical protein KXX34_007611 [Aspergillus fumigatus]KAH2603491.1 hypothetical protein KXW93_007839 [Aspergillus fumigatus]
MLPAFQINNFKPWAPLPAKPFPSHRTLNACSPRTPNPHNPEPCHVPPPSTLPLPKHHLPARPPAEVCVHVTANTQLESEQSSFPETSGHSAAYRRNSVPHVPASDLIRRCDPQDDAGTLTKPPGFRADLASPSSSSSADSLGGFFMLPDAPQDNIPIDPVILADLGSWEGNDLLLPGPPADSLINPVTTCLYPEPPAILNSPGNPFGDPAERNGSGNGVIQTSDRERQQVHLTPHSTDPDPSFPTSIQGKHHIGREPRNSKRKTQKPNSRIRKSSRVRSALGPREGSFPALRSYFVSLPLDDRLQFLSWLFESALSHCMSDTSPTACGEGELRPTYRPSPQPVIEQSPRVIRRNQRSSRKRVPWSIEEEDLLVKLRKDEGRSWSDVTRVFSKQYPGRSQGAIQVFWCTTLSKRSG